MRKIILFLLMSLLLTGCTKIEPAKGGKAFVAGDQMEIQQPDNPSSPATQERTKTNFWSLFLPANTEIELNGAKFYLTAPTFFWGYGGESFFQKIGEAYQDTTKELSARLESMKMVRIAGIALVVLGLIQSIPYIFYLFGGSRSFQFLCIAVGTGLIVLPNIISGYEKEVLVASIILLILWWFGRRYGEKDGMIKALTQGGQNAQVHQKANS